MSHQSASITAKQIFYLAQRNLKLKYKSSVIGYVWSFLTPLLFLLIFNFVFSKVFASVENYSLYVISGLVFWQFFNNSVNQTINSFLQNAGLIKTININLIAYPTSSLLTEIGNLLITFIPFLLIMFGLGYKLDIKIIQIIPISMLLGLFALGIGIALGALNVFLRDIGILWNSLNPALFYASPIAYAANFIPEKYQPILKLNPLYSFFGAIRKPLYSNEWLTLEEWGILIGMTSITCLLGVGLFRKIQPGIISNI